MFAAYENRIAGILRDFGIAPNYGELRQLPLHEEEEDLDVARTLSDGRQLRLSRATLPHWRQLVESAAGDGITLLLISGFRSVEHQKGIIESKLAKGIPLDQILSVNAAPGYSEHHTGRAVDIGTPGCPPLSDAFEQTGSFRWLAEHAIQHGFRMSYPRGHTHGFVHEPWHWMWSRF